MQQILPQLIFLPIIFLPAIYEPGKKMTGKKINARSRDSWLPSPSLGLTAAAARRLENSKVRDFDGHHFNVDQEKCSKRLFVDVVQTFR